MDGSYKDNRLAQDDRFDPKEIIFVKRLLQYALPEHARQLITDRLFRTYVTQDEHAFACEIYMSFEQMRCMLRNGMYFGSHGYEHCWINKLTPTQQAREIDLSLEFLASAGAVTTDWVMCYPYGGHDASLINLLKDRGCKLGFTTEPRVAGLV